MLVAAAASCCHNKFECGRCSFRLRFYGVPAISVFFTVWLALHRHRHTTHTFICRANEFQHLPFQLFVYFSLFIAPVSMLLCLCSFSFHFGSVRSYDCVMTVLSVGVYECIFFYNNFMPDNSLCFSFSLQPSGASTEKSCNMM